MSRLFLGFAVLFACLVGANHSQAQDHQQFRWRYVLDPGTVVTYHYVETEKLYGSYYGIKENFERRVHTQMRFEVQSVDENGVMTLDIKTIRLGDTNVGKTARSTGLTNNYPPHISIKMNSQGSSFGGIILEEDSANIRWKLSRNIALGSQAAKRSDAVVAANVVARVFSYARRKDVKDGDSWVDSVDTEKKNDTAGFTMKSRTDSSAMATSGWASETKGKRTTTITGPGTVNDYPAFLVHRHWQGRVSERGLGRDVVGGSSETSVEYDDTHYLRLSDGLPLRSITTQKRSKGYSRSERAYSATLVE